MEERPFPQWDELQRLTAPISLLKQTAEKLSAQPEKNIVQERICAFQADLARALCPENHSILQRYHRTAAILGITHNGLQEALKCLLVMNMTKNAFQLDEPAIRSAVGVYVLTVAQNLKNSWDWHIDPPNSNRGIAALIFLRLFLPLVHPDQTESIQNFIAWFTNPMDPQQQNLPQQTPPK
ncbi:MAG: hypothetical protein WCS85_05200 [Candidatus Peribacteraceae bacterium]